MQTIKFNDFGPAIDHMLWKSNTKNNDPVSQEILKRMFPKIYGCGGDNEN